MRYYRKRIGEMISVCDHLVCACLKVLEHIRFFQEWGDVDWDNNSTAGDDAADSVSAPPRNDAPVDTTASVSAGTDVFWSQEIYNSW